MTTQSCSIQLGCMSDAMGLSKINKILIYDGLKYSFAWDCCCVAGMGRDLSSAKSSVMKPEERNTGLKSKSTEQMISPGY